MNREKARNIRSIGAERLIRAVSLVLSLYHADSRARLEQVACKSVAMDKCRLRCSQ